MALGVTHAPAPVRATAPARRTGRPRATAEGVARTAPGPSAGPLGHQPDPYTRAVLQGAVGRDVGDVRVRTGRAQDEALAAAGVDAAASGHDVALRSDHDHAGTVPGRVLLLHELVHVLQQAGRVAHEGAAGGTLGVTVAADLEERAHATAVELAVRSPGARDRVPDRGAGPA